MCKGRNKHMTGEVTPPHVLYGCNQQQQHQQAWRTCINVCRHQLSQQVAFAA
jgi:hypothetical protein